MNDAFSRIMDVVAMGLSVAAAIFCTIVLYKKALQPVRSVPLFFALLGPVAIAVHMMAHLVGVGSVAGSKIAAGTFLYDFRFYALLLMAGVLLVLSIQLVQCTRAAVLNNKSNKKQRLILCCWIALVEAPTIPFTFIGSLPVQAVLLHGAAMFFLYKKRRAAAPNLAASTGNAAAGVY